MDEAIKKQQKGDWNEWHKDMGEQVPLSRDFLKLIASSQIVHPEPKKKKKPLRNWLTRIKRIGRKKQ